MKKSPLGLINNGLSQTNSLASLNRIRSKKVNKGQKESQKPRAINKKSRRIQMTEKVQGTGSKKISSK